MSCPAPEGPPAGDTGDTQTHGHAGQATQTGSSSKASAGKLSRLLLRQL